MVACGPELWRSHDAVRRHLVHEGLVEEPEEELLAEQSAHRDIDPRLIEMAVPHRRDEQLRRSLAPELVDPGIHGFDDPLARGEVLDTPRPRREVGAEDVLVGDQPPIRTDHPVEPEAVAQQPGQDAAVEAERDLLVLRAHRHSVVRHDLAHPVREGREERLQVQLELPTGIDLLAPIGEVGVLAVQLRAAAGEVFDHRRDRLGPKGLPLEPADVGSAELSRQCGVLTEGLKLTRPARLGRQVDLRVQSRAQANRQVLAAGNVPELLNELGVAGRCDRNAESRVLRGPLEVVAPSGHLPGRRRGTEEVEVRHVPDRQIVGRGRQSEGGVTLR